MSNAATNNETIIRWYNGVQYTISELHIMQNVVIEGHTLAQIIEHVLTHGSFNPICAANNQPRFGLAIELVYRGDDDNDCITAETARAAKIRQAEIKQMNDAFLKDQAQLKREWQQMLYREFLAGGGLFE